MYFNHHYILKCLSVLDRKFETLQLLKQYSAAASETVYNRELVRSEGKMSLPRKSFQDA